VEKKREESITEYLSRVSALREQIEAATGAALQDADVIGSILNGLPTKYSTIKQIIENMAEQPDLATVTAKLLVVEADQPRDNEAAYYSGSNPPRPFGGIKQQVYTPPHKLVCWFCGDMGHIKKDCPIKERADKVRPKAGMGPTDFSVIAL
jgi:hypothetical protein